MTASRKEAPPMSAECVLAQKQGYEELHHECRETKDIPLPGATEILLLPRCGCRCHDHESPSA
jgi:hypothetical protein